LRRRAGARPYADRRFTLVAGPDPDDGKAPRRRRLHQGTSLGRSPLPDLRRSGGADAALPFRAYPARPLARCRPGRPPWCRPAGGGEAPLYALSPVILNFSADLRRARGHPCFSHLALSLLGNGIVWCRDRGGATGLALARRGQAGRVIGSSIARFEKVRN